MRVRDTNFQRFVHNRLTGAVIATLMLASGVMTLWGLRLIYDLGADGHSDPWAATLVPLGGAVTLHLLIMKALTTWLATRRLRAFLLGVLPLSLLAVAVSYGAHWTHFNGERVTVLAFEAAQTQTERGVRAFAQSFDYVVDQVSGLAAHSRRQAEIEAKSGTSCAADAGEGRGPRYDLRMQDQARFADLQARIEARRATLRKLLAETEGASAANAAQSLAGAAVLRRVVNGARAVEGDPLIVEIRTALEARIALGRGAIPLPAGRRLKSGAAGFSCPDPTLEERASAVLAAIRGLKPVPDVEVADARDGRTGFAMAYGRLWSHAKGFFATQSRRLRGVGQTAQALEPSGVAGRDLIPLVTALTLEAFLIVLAATRGGFPGHPSLHVLSEIEAERLEPTIQTTWRKLGGVGSFRDAIYANARFAHNALYVCVTLEPTDPSANVLHQMMEVLTQTGLATRDATDPLVFADWYRARLAGDARREVLDRTTKTYRIDNVGYFAILRDTIADAREHAAKIVEVEQPAKATQAAAAEQDVAPARAGARTPFGDDFVHDFEEDAGHDFPGDFADRAPGAPRRKEGAVYLLPPAAA